MTDLRSAAQQALVAMDKATRYMSFSDHRKLNEAITDLKAALEKPEQDCAECNRWQRAVLEQGEVIEQLKASLEQRSIVERIPPEESDAEFVAQVEQTMCRGSAGESSAAVVPAPTCQAECPRCGKVTRPDDVHTCTPKALRLADALSSNGEGCECRASSYYECGCDGAIWPEMYVLETAAELRRLHAMTERRLTDEIIAELWYKNGTYHHHFARAIERWLKGQE